MTAFDTYFSAVDRSILPATVPIATVDGRGFGIATSTFDVSKNAEAMKYAASDNPRVRATAAIYACRAAREAVDASAELTSA